MKAVNINVTKMTTENIFFLIKCREGSYLTGVPTIFETVKCSLGNITIGRKGQLQHDLKVFPHILHFLSHRQKLSCNASDAKTTVETTASHSAKLHQAVHLHILRRSSSIFENNARAATRQEEVPFFLFLFLSFF